MQKVKYVFLILSIILLTGCGTVEKKDSVSEDYRKRAIEYRQMGYEAQGRGDLEQALYFYKMAIGLDPDYATVYNDLGIIYESQGFIGPAEEYYLKAIASDEDYLPAYTNLAYLYEKKGDLLKAAEYWAKRILQGAPGEYWTEKARESLQDLSNLSEQVRRKYKNLLKKPSEDKHKITTQGAVVKQKETAETDSSFELGKTLFSQGDYTAARMAFEHSLSVNPDNPAAQQYYQEAKAKETDQQIDQRAETGLRLQEAGYAGAAEEEFKKLLTLFPTHNNQR